MNYMKSAELALSAKMGNTDWTNSSDEEQSFVIITYFFAHQGTLGDVARTNAFGNAVSYVLGL